MKTKLEQVESGTSAADYAKYALAAAILAGGIAGYYLLEWATPIRVLVVILSTIASVAVWLFTAKGRDAQEFMSESLFELRKVVWPTHDETRKTTIMVLIVVTIISLLLALFDWIISFGIRFLLGS